MVEVQIWNFWWLFLEQINGIYFTDMLIVLIVAALVCIVPGYVLHIKRGVSVKRIILAYLTVAYMGVILLLTVFRRDPGSKSGKIYTHLNLGLTRTTVYSTRQVMYSLMNFALFVPWGILMGLFRTDEKPLRVLVMTTLTGFITSFLIETIQHFTKTGFFEVTDLLTNTAGTFCGAFFVAILLMIIKRKTGK